MNPAPVLLAAAAVGIYMYFNRSVTPPFSREVLARFNDVQYFIILQSLRHGVPSWIMYRIAFIESTFRTQVVGPVGEIGMFQITAPLLNDFNSANATNHDLDFMFEPNPASDVAAWAIAWHLDHYNGNIENAVKAYNTGRGGIDLRAARVYWERFQTAGQYFPEP